MKKIFKFLGLAALAAAVLTGCSDLNTASDSGSSSSSASSSGAYIKIVDGSAALKTIVPDYDTTFSNFSSFKLYCASTPTDGSSITWDDSNLLKTVSSSSDLTGSTYSVPEGNVTFHLEANHTSQSVYTATTATKIGNGSNTVAFTLCPKEYKIGTGFYGNVDITLSFPSKVKAVDAKLYTYDITQTAALVEYNSALASKTYIASANATNKISSNSLNYNVQSVQSGIYIAQFKLYADYSTTTNGVTGTGKNPLTTYNEVVVVSSQGTSKATRTLTDADLAVPVYTVTYKNIDASDTTIPTTLTYDNVYLRGANSIQVPSVVTGTTGIRKTLDTDEVYTFAGWYTDEALTTPATLYSGADCGENDVATDNALQNPIYYPVTSGDITLYGKWTINIAHAIKPCTNVPYNNFSVGDIILAHDTTGAYYQLANKYAQFVTKKELKDWCDDDSNPYTRQAVVFYVPQTTNSDGTASANPNASILGQTRVLAVNIDNSTSDGADGTKFQWATSDAAGYTKALTSLGVARNDMVTLEGNTVYEYPTGTEYGSWKDGSTTYQALFDGEASGGTAITKLATIDDTSIQTALQELTNPVTATTAKYSDYVSVLGNYPAFKYVMETYNPSLQDEVYSSKAGTAGSGSWYLPSVVQLLELYKNKDVVNAVIAKMDGDKLEKRFWSCSQVVKYGKDAWSVDFAATNVADAAQYDGDTSAGHGKAAHFFVCAISNIK